MKERQPMRQEQPIRSEEVIPTQRMPTPEDLIQARLHDLKVRADTLRQIRADLKKFKK